MDRNAFASLATFKLPSPCRLLASACCSDKDLVVLIARLGGRDRISLWKMQGSRKWEVDIAADDVPATVAGLAWHPDGQTIAVVHESGLITMHSVQDGRTERSLSINREAQTATKVTGVWWFPGPSESMTNVIPDIFKRNGVKTGSALSILKILPMLDPLKETSGHVTATDLFAFQGTQTSTRQVSVPDVISQWPSLAPILEDISISSPDQNDENHKGGSQGSSSQKTDEDSLLVLADERGGLHLFLAGTYCLGTIALPGGHPPIFLYKHPGQPVLLFHSESPEGDLFSVVVQPTPVNIPLLGTLAVRDFARLSSAARELTRYIMSVLDELKEGWLSSTSVTGAREIGKTWVESLEKRLKEDYGQENSDVVFELTSFLVTGSMSEGLSDFIVSSDQTSERALQKWDNAVTDALTKMCDYSNMRVIPALQRLHIVLDEIHGWSLMSHYAAFGLDTGDIITCLHLVEHGIFVSAWLAAEAKKELRTFKHFLNFIRYEMTVANMSGESQTFLDYDILEVNNYLMSGFMTSQIDRWFTGSAPRFNPGELCTSQTPKSLDEALELAHTAFQDPSQTAWQPSVTRIELSQLDRNLDALVQELATRCQRVFAQASPATARSATVPADGGAVPTKARELSPTPENNCLFIRQRVVCDDNEPNGSLQYLVALLNLEGQCLLCLSRMPYGQYTRMAGSSEVAILECSVDTNNDGGGDLDMLDGEFFDDEVIVLVYRIKGTQGPIYVGTMNYTMLRYQRLESEGYVSGPAQKDMIVDMLQRWKEGHLMGGGVPITKCRRLSACKSGSISMALNGRVGRRVVCVLGGDGVTMEVIDMEGDEMEADEESEMEMVSRDMIVTEGDLGP